ncbi:hypothetical protein BV898_05275 [Hypsibius exemplaris]|nr:hypothetical protein BV898_05275 [Hypsibius exemplaris]
MGPPSPERSTIRYLLEAKSTASHPSRFACTRRRDCHPTFKNSQFVLLPPKPAPIQLAHPPHSINSRAARRSVAKSFIKVVNDCINQNDLPFWRRIQTFAFVVFSLPDEPVKKVFLVSVLQNNLSRLNDFLSQAPKPKRSDSELATAVERKMQDGNGLKWSSGSPVAVQKLLENEKNRIVAKAKKEEKEKEADAEDLAVSQKVFYDAQKKRCSL